MVEAAYDAMRAGRNQYPPGHGSPELVEAVIGHQPRHYGLELAPENVVVTTGATEAIAAAMLGLVDPGDEVLVCEPYYDSYRAMIQFCGGVRRPLTLRAPDYRLDLDELERVGDRPHSKLILLNTPHNPTGRVLDADELAGVAEVARRHDLVVVTDEVYEHLTYDEHRARADRDPAGHVRAHGVDLELRQDLLLHRLEDRLGHRARRPGRRRRGRQELAVLLLRSAVPARHRPRARARVGLPRAAARRPVRRRDHLCDGLASLGLEVHVPQGTYFVTTDVSTLGQDDGIAFCAGLADRAKVVAIPSQVFYEDGSEEGRHLVRWAFCKEQDVIVEGLRRLRATDLHRG